MMATKAEKNFEKALLELASEDASTALSAGLPGYAGDNNGDQE